MRDMAHALNLENHCKRRLDATRYPWSTGCGFIRSAWIGDDDEILDVAPSRGESRRLYLDAPFQAAVGEVFHVLWEPALVVFNGWEPEVQARITEVRIVRCRLLEVFGSAARAVGWSPSHGVDVRVDVLECFDPMTVEPRSGEWEASLTAWPFHGGRPQSTQIQRAHDRVLVQGTTEGDINFDLLVDPTLQRVAMVVDTSICEAFFWFGSVSTSKELREALAQLVDGT